MSFPKIYLEKLNSRMIGLSVRERVLATFVLLVVLFFVVVVFLLNPMDRRRQELRSQSDNIFAQILTYQSELNALASSSATDPTLAAQQKLKSLRSAGADMERQSQQLIGELTVQQEPALILQKFLRKDSGLRVVELKKGKAIPFSFNDEDSGAEDSGLISQSFEIELEGSYTAFLSYLKTIENSSLNVFWDDLELEVLSHPKNRIILKIHTLSPAMERPDV